MIYHEVEEAGRPKTKGRCRRATHRGEEERSPMPDVFWFWNSSLRPDVMCSGCRCCWLLSLRPNLRCCWLLWLMFSVLALLYIFFFFLINGFSLLDESVAHALVSLG